MKTVGAALILSGLVLILFGAFGAVIWVSLSNSNQLLNPAYLLILLGVTLIIIGVNAFRNDPFDF
jgi:uncharacterized membrane protein